MRPLVALNGWGNVPTGLGSENRWLWHLLPFEPYLVAKHPILGWGDPLRDSPRRVLLGGDGRMADAVVCVERPVPERREIPEHQKLIVLVNPEYASPRSSWWDRADAMVARTPQAQRALAAHGVSAPLIPVPIDLSELPFSSRLGVDRVRFTNGFGGLQQRRGEPEVGEMIELGARIEVYSASAPKHPACVGALARGRVATSEQLYRGADLIIMPSRFEGLGLTALEAMASGALVAATDAEPMSDVIRGAYGDRADLFLLPCSPGESVSTSAHDAYPTWRVDPKEAVARIDAIRSLPARETRELSFLGRNYVHQKHGREARDALWSHIRGVIG